MAQRVGMLAPMEHELQPLVRLLDLERDDSVYRGRAGNVEVVALLTKIGMAAGAEAARRMLGFDVDHMIVVGIAGGVGKTVTIGTLVVPQTVVERASGAVYAPTVIGDVAPRGILSCGDDLIIDPPVLAAMAADGVVAVDMETAGVAAICDEAGCPWSVFRGISDDAGGGLVDEGLFALTRPDGTADPDALARYLADDPGRAEVLGRLAHDMTVATEVAATAAIRACSALQDGRYEP